MIVRSAARESLAGDGTDERGEIRAAGTKTSACVKSTARNTALAALLRSADERDAGMLSVFVETGMSMQDTLVASANPRPDSGIDNPSPDGVTQGVPAGSIAT